MPPGNSFQELLAGVRRGNADAARELVQKYESAIRVAVRTRLSDPSLRRQLDSMDICQSVLKSFFFRVAAGMYDLSEPAQLVALLTKMAQNKLAMQVRRHHRQRRDTRRTGSLSQLLEEPPSAIPGPAREAAGRELLERAYKILDPEIRRMANLRVDGAGWMEIAGSMGGTAEGRRKQFQRAIDRAAAALEIDLLEN